MTVSGPRGRSLLAGSAEGPLLVLDEPLSFWGGVEAETGAIIDRRHPQSGALVSGTVLAMPSGRGSSSASSVLAEAIRLGTAPAAILLSRPDEILLLGALVAAELYGTVCPVVVLPEPTYRMLTTGERVRVGRDGSVTVVAG